MNPQLQIAVIAASAAILGSVVGTLGSFFSTRAVTREQRRTQYVEKQIAAREQLYSDFIAEATRLALAALDAKTSRAGEFTLLHSLQARIRLLGSPEVIAAAERILSRCIRFHGSEEQAKAAEMESGSALFASDFSQACRKELEEFGAKI